MQLRHLHLDHYDSSPDKDNHYTTGFADIKVGGVDFSMTLPKQLVAEIEKLVLEEAKIQLSAIKLAIE